MFEEFCTCNWCCRTLCLPWWKGNTLCSVFYCLVKNNLKENSFVSSRKNYFKSVYKVFDTIAERLHKKAVRMTKDQFSMCLNSHLKFYRASNYSENLEFSFSLLWTSYWKFIYVFVDELTNFYTFIIIY